MTIRAALLVCLLIAPAAFLRAAEPEADSPFSAYAAWPGQTLEDAVVQADEPVAENPPTSTPESVLKDSTDAEAQISLKEAVLLALRNNLDIELARTEPAIAEEGVQAAKGAYDPVAATNFSFDRVQRQTANPLQASGGGANALNLTSQN